MILIALAAFSLTVTSVTGAVPAQLRLGFLHPAYKPQDKGFAYDKGGHCRMAASLLALKHINADSNILPDTTLQYEWIDSKRDSATALMGAITHSQDSFGGVGADVIVGPASSGPSKAANLVLGAIPVPVPQMSYSATSPSLSEKAQYKTFFRTPPSDSFQGTTLAEVLTDVLGYTDYCMIIASDDYSSAGAKAFEDAAKLKGMTQIEKVIVTEDPTPKETYEAVQKTKNALCRVVFTMTQACAGGKITAAAKDAGIIGSTSGYLWVLTDAWSTNFGGAQVCADVSEGFTVPASETELLTADYTIPGLTEAEFKEAWTGTIGASPLFPKAGMAKFDQFLIDWGNQANTNGVCPGDGTDSELTGTERTTNVCTCSTEVDNGNNKVWELDHDVDPATPSICTGFDFAGVDNAKPASSYAYFAYDAVLAFARAAHHALYDATTPFTGSDFTTKEGKQAIMDALYEIEFDGVSGTISFQNATHDFTGDRKAGCGNVVTNYDGTDFIRIGDWTTTDGWAWDAAYPGGETDMTWTGPDNAKPNNKILPACLPSHLKEPTKDDCGSDAKRKITYAFDTNADGLVCDPLLAESITLPTGQSVNCEYTPGSSLAGSLGFFMGIAGALISIFWAVYVFLNMNTKVMKVAQPTFCIVFTLSAALLSISNVLFIGENTDGNCVLRPFVFNIAFDLMFGSLFMKTLRVYKIFGNKKLSKVRISGFDIVKNYGSIIAVDIAILIVWLATEGMKVVEVANELQYDKTWTANVCNEAETYSTLTTFFKILMVIGGVYLSYLTRNVPDKFAESKWIAMSIYQVFVLGAIGLLVKFTDDSGGQTLALVQGICVPLACTATTCCIFVPKLMMIRNPQDYEDALKTSSGQTSTGHTSSGSTEKDELEARIEELEAEIKQLKGQ